MRKEFNLQNPGGRRPFGRSGHRCEGNIKMYLKKIE
jgi:hypothetical protein